MPHPQPPRIAILLSSLLAIALPLSASATQITVDFMGTVVGTASGDFAGESGMVSGHYSYDTDLMLSVSGSTFEKYQSAVLDADNGGFESSWELVMTLGGATVSYGAWNQLTLTDKATDQYNFAAAGNRARIALMDSSGSAISALTGSAPSSAPDLADWSFARGYAPGLQFIITKLEVASPASHAPEPTSALLFGAGLLVAGRSIRQRGRS
jgi:hypothetical protein